MYDNVKSPCQSTNDWCVSKVRRVWEGGGEVMLMGKMMPRLIITAPSANISDRKDGLANSYETVQLRKISFFSKLNLSGTMDPKDFLSEAHIMKRLRHPKLIQVWLGFFNNCGFVVLLRVHFHLSPISALCSLHFRGAHLYCHRTYEIWQSTGVSAGIYPPTDQIVWDLSKQF